MLSKDKENSYQKLYGRSLHWIGASDLSPAEEELSDTISLDDYLIKNREATTYARGRVDDRCRNHGGRYAARQRTDKAKSGNIVIAM